MRKNIAFYISDHTMGHALRTIPILQNMLKIEDEVQIFVKSGKDQIRFMESYMDFSERLHFYEMEMKDKETEYFEELAETEEKFLREEEIGLVVSDICPWIFLAADSLRMKSILIGNYTWADLCEDEEEKEEYLSCYELASRIFIYDLYTPNLTGYGVEYELVSMINRPYNMKEIETMSKQPGGAFVFIDLPRNKEKGFWENEKDLQEKLDISHLPYSFVVTDGTPFTGENVVVLSKDVKNRQDYVAASRFLITYGSWNRIAEAVLSNRKAAYLVREDLPMSCQMIDILVRRKQGLMADKRELHHFDKLLLKLEEFSYSYDHEYYNSDYDLAKKILFAYPEKRRRNRS